MDELKGELVAIRDQIAAMVVAVDSMAEEAQAMQAEARCPECHRVSYVDPPRHAQHREVDCTHCGHFFWLGALYVANDRVPDLSCALLEAELAVKKGKGRQP